MPIKSIYTSLRNNLYHHPTIFASFVLAIGGPLLLATVYPMRRELGYTPPVDAPKSFPMPKGPRTRPTGYDD
ncbi:hypothetical protein HDU85_007758 [Gaertneriomyces sp. JEL0708]|nr:hypothetical protein BC832DRAFT_592873 [Gaertneriomyces semiglobifer]KAJ3186318.1 hypothetical protein HDU85_007758 [Gaertneriomyces sp. JEL0708]